MLKGQLDKKTVKAKGTAAHNFVGSVNATTHFKGQPKVSKNKVAACSMSMKRTAMKGQPA